MEKQIKDYLKYHIGCDCKHVSVVGDMFQLTAVQSNSDLVVIRNHKDRRGGIHTSASNIKPILRKISSMTEDELKQCVVMMEGYWPSAVPVLMRKREAEGRTWSQWYYVWESGEKILANLSDDKNGFSLCNGNEYYRCYIKLIPYLLSKGFDLFNLIDEGLALDAETITTK